MRTSPGPGAPISTSSKRSSSGPPCWWKRKALVMLGFRRLGRASWRDPTSRAESVGSRARALDPTYDNLRRHRLEVEPQRLHHARVHVVARDQHGQFHDLAIVEMRLDLVEHLVGDDDVACHAVGIGERGAL